MSAGNHGTLTSTDLEGKLGQNSKHDLTDFGATLNVLKYCIGLGIISLPMATKHVGWLPSLVGFGILTTLTIWGIFFAIESQYKLDKLEEQEGDSLMAGSWRNQPNSGIGFFDKVVGKVFGPFAQNLFVLSVVLGQFITLVVYINAIVANLMPYFSGGVHRILVLTWLAIVLAMLSLIPSLQGVSYLSAAGLSIYTFLFVGLVHELNQKMHDGTLAKHSMVVAAGHSNYGEWFGISCFAFSGLPVAVLVHDEMRNPQQFRNVIIGSYVLIWCLYSVFAMLGFLCYGDDAKTLIYFNFKEDSVFRNGSSAALAGILGFSFVVQAMPVFNYTTEVWAQSSGIGSKLGFQGLPQNLPMPIVRWTVVALSAAVAYSVPSIDALLNGCGGTSGVLVGFIFPACTYFKLSSPDEWLARCRCCAVVAVGVVGGFYSLAAL